MPDIHQAATVLLFRDTSNGPEVFMVQRSLDSAFMPGAFVFPGGKVDPEDGRAEDICVDPGPFDRRYGLEDNDIRAILVAGIRECFEEAGVLLARPAGDSRAFDASTWKALEKYRSCLQDGSGSMKSLARDLGLRLSIDEVLLFSHWITPANEPRRFDTYFLATRCPSGVRPIHDEHETIESTWITPAEALSRHRHDSVQFPLAPPTFRTLESLCDYTNTDELLEATARRPVPAIQPVLRLVENGAILLLPGDPAYDGPSPDRVEGHTRIVLCDQHWESMSVD